MIQIDQLVLSTKILEKIYYDADIRRYRWIDDKKFVSKTVVKLMVDRKIDFYNKELVKLAPDIISKKPGIYIQTAEILKKIHLLSAVKGADGIENVSQVHLGKLSGVLRNQFYAGKDFSSGKPYGLKHLFKELEARPQSELMVASRLRMYGRSGGITENIIKEDLKISEGVTQMSRQLGATHQHCNECINYARLGWVPIGNLPVPKTQCSCLNNCVCSVFYR